jgi:hypothetical protein
MNPLRENRLNLTRREFFGRSACGLGTAALASLMTREGLAAPVAGLPGLPHFAPKAKHVIYLFQNGAPTHVELFDFKPKLAAMHGQPVPESYLGDKRFSTMTGSAHGKLMLAPIEPFKKHGDCGATVSALLPHTAGIVDDLCFVKSLHTDAVNHAPAISLLLSGAQIPGRPTAGAWLAYGLGTETDQLALVRRDDVGEQRHDLWADLLRLLLGIGLPPLAVPGREVPRRRRPGALPVEPRRPLAHHAPRLARRHRQTQRAQTP